MNLVIYSTASIVAFGVSIGTAYNASGGDIGETLRLVFVTKARLLAVVNLAYCFLYLFGKLTQAIFFGKLRDVEAQNLHDRLLYYILFKVVFVGAVMEPDLKELLIWTSWFSILGFLKIFTLLSRDRFEYISTFSPNTHPSVHIKLLTLLFVLLFSDLGWMYLCVRVFFDAGLSILLLLTFECCSVFLDNIQTLLKYSIHLIDLAHTQQGRVWEQRGQSLYITEFVTDSLILAGALAHYMHILYLHGLQVSLLDAVLFMHMRIVFNNLRGKIVAYRNYRKLAANMNSQYPSVSAEELAVYNDDCAICRESMESAKKLPCNHLFHPSCLRSWLEAHHSCPTCRRSLIDNNNNNANTNVNRNANNNQNNAGPVRNPEERANIQPPGGQGQGSNSNLYPGHMNPQFVPPHMAPHLLGANPNQHTYRFGAPAWFGGLFPSVQFEVTRGIQPLHPHQHQHQHQQPPNFPWPLVTNEMVRAVQDIFPHVSAQAIAADLAITRSVEATTENILEGRISIPPVNVYTPPSGSPSNQNPMSPPLSQNNISNANIPLPTSPSPLQSPSLNPVSANNNSNSNSNSSNSNSNNDNNPPSSSSSSSSNFVSPNSAPAMLPKFSDKFSPDPAERSQNLQARKQAMLEAARKQYLETQTRKNAPPQSQQHQPQPQSQSTNVIPPSSNVSQNNPPVLPHHFQSQPSQSQSQLQPPQIRHSPLLSSQSQSQSQSQVLHIPPVSINNNNNNNSSNSNDNNDNNNNSNSNSNPPSPLVNAVTESPIPSPVPSPLIESEASSSPSSNSNIVLPQTPEEKRLLLLEAAQRRGVISRASSSSPSTSNTNTNPNQNSNINSKDF